MKDEVESERETMIENIAEADDALIEKYLDGQALSDEEIKSALRKGIWLVSSPLYCVDLQQ